MADADVQITAGSGTKVDTRTVGAGTDEHRQVVVLGDPTTAANVAIVDSSGRILSVVEGAVAHDAVDSGNPIKIGGKAGSTTPDAVADGDRVNAWFGTRGQLVTLLGNPTTGDLAFIRSSSSHISDNVTAAASLAVSSQNWIYNGGAGTYDRQRSASATGDGGGGTGITAAGLVAFNGSTWDRVRVANTGRLQVDVATADGGGQSTSVATGTLTAADQTIEIVADGYDVVTIVLSGTWVADVDVEATYAASPGSTDWFSVLANSYDGVHSPFDANTRAHVPLLGYRRIRVHTDAYTSGTVDVSLTAAVGGAAGVVGLNGERLDVYAGGASGLDNVALQGTIIGVEAAVKGWSGAGHSGIKTDAALADASTTNRGLAVAPIVYNGATWDRLRGDTAGLFAQGNVAHDAVDSGNPTKGGGVAVSGVPTAVAAGDRVNASFDVRGTQRVTLVADDDGSPMLTSGSGLLVEQGSPWSASVEGNAAHDAADSGDPVKIGGVANNSAPSAVGTGDRVNAWYGITGAQQVMLRSGVTGDYLENEGFRLAPGTANIGDVDVLTLPAPHVTGSTALGIGAAFTSTQTSTNLIAGTGGQRIYVTNLTIATGGTTAGRVSIYYGTGAFTAGTSVTLFDGEFAPSATARPGAVLSFTVPVGGASATGDNLRITTSAAMTVYVTGQAYKA